MTTSAADALQLMDQFRESVKSITGIEQFTGAAQGFLEGEIEMEEATTQMMSFLRGDIAGSAVERGRLIELAQEIQTQCGTISITILTVTSCTIVLSCTGC